MPCLRLYLLVMVAEDILAVVASPAVVLEVAEDDLGNNFFTLVVSTSSMSIAVPYSKRIMGITSCQLPTSLAVDGLATIQSY